MSFLVLIAIVAIVAVMIIMYSEYLYKLTLLRKSKTHESEYLLGEFVVLVPEEDYLKLSAKARDMDECRRIYNGEEKEITLEKGQ